MSTKQSRGRLREHFLRQAGWCEGRSPLYASLCRRLADDPRVEELAAAPRWDVPLRLLAGLHHLVLEGRARWDAIDEALDRHASFLARFVAEHEVQTNEVQRSWALLPAFLSLADGRPLDLLELGPSAGLNLVWDRYRYAYASGGWGSGVLELRGDDRVPPPGTLLSRRVAVVRRRGVDRSPIDVTRDEGALLLQSFVWADQAERLARLRAAIEVVRDEPPELIRGDYVASLPSLLAERVDGAQLVVYETASTQYLDRAAREALHEALHHAGREEPLTFLTTRSSPDRDFYTLEAVAWPSGRRCALLHLDFHGAWLEWLGDTG
jgi:hypothetical protein